MICPESFKDLKSIALSSSSVKQKSWETTLWDTKKQDLFNAQMVLRERLTSKQIKTSLKKNFDHLPLGAEWTQVQALSFLCEGDYYLNRSKIGCSLKHTTKEMPFFSKNQETAIHQLTSITVDDLRSFGPVPTESIEFTDSKISKEEMVLESMNIKDKLVSELSMRASIQNYQVVYQEVLEKLNQQKIQLCSTDESKTRLILDSYQ